MAEDKTRYPALFDGQLQTPGYGKTKLLDLTNDCGESFAFQYFFGCPEDFFFSFQIDKNAPVRFDAEGFQAERKKFSRGTDPYTGAPAFHKRGDQACHKSAGGCATFRAAAYKFMNDAGRENRVRKSGRDWSQADIDRGGGCPPESLPEKDFFSQLVDNILFCRKHGEALEINLNL
jgi:hypothetical protein